MSLKIERETLGQIATRVGYFMVGLIIIALPIIDASIKPENYVPPRVQLTNLASRQDGCVDLITRKSADGSGTIGKLNEKDPDFLRVRVAFRNEDPSLKLITNGAGTWYCIQ